MRVMSGVVLMLVLCGCAGISQPEPINIKDKKELTISVGTVMYADMKVHGSVGFSARCQVDDENIVKLTGSKLTYTYPERMKPGMTGGDKAKRRYTFEALKSGTTEIRLFEYFRGKLEKTYTIKVTVK